MNNGCRISVETGRDDFILYGAGSNHLVGSGEGLLVVWWPLIGRKVDNAIW